MSASAVFAQETEFTVEPVKYSFILPKMGTLPFDIKSFRENKTGCDITYIVSGKGIIHIDSKSIQIDAVVDENGNDISTDGGKGKAWETEPFPKASSDGTCAKFSVFVATENAMTRPTIKGSVKITTASETKTERLKFKTGGESEAQKAGALDFSIDDGENWLEVFMDGHNSLVPEIKLEAGGKEIKRVSYSYGHKGATYYFEKIDEPEFDLIVTHYVDAKETEVVFGK